MASEVGPIITFSKMRVAFDNKLLGSNGPLNASGNENL
jgi:hypothetical protein